MTHRWPPGQTGWSADWTDEKPRTACLDEPQEDRDEHAVPPEVVRVMQAYGSATWLRVVQVGWNGGRVEPGESRNLFRQKLNEAGFHFVPHNFNNYLRIQDGRDLEHVEVTLQRIEKEMRHDRDVLMAAGKLTSREARTGRSRVKVKYPVLTIGEDSDGPRASLMTKPADTGHKETYDTPKTWASGRQAAWPTSTTQERAVRYPPAGSGRYGSHSGYSNYYCDESQLRPTSAPWPFR